MFRKAYDPVIDNPTINTLPSRVKQAFAKECNINTIISKARKGTGKLFLNNQQPMFGDFTNVMEYQEMKNQIIAAEQAFADLPANVRERFGNEPAKLLGFLENPENQEEAVRLGLAVVKQPEKTPEAIELRR